MKKSGKIPIWAIVLIIVGLVLFFLILLISVLGILGYYYFSSDVITPSFAVVNPPFYLNSQNAETSGIKLEFKNNGGENYIIKSVEISSCGKTSNQAIINKGEIKEFYVPCSLTKGSTFKGSINVIYLKEGSTLELISSGSMTEPVQ